MENGINIWVKMTAIKEYKHIVWDWNGTLFDDVSLCVEIINGVITRRGLKPLSVAEYKKIFTFPVEDYYKKAGLDLEKYSFQELGREWMAEYERRKKECDLFEGAKNILHKISDMGLGQSILSAYSQHTLEEMVEKFNLDRYFIHLIGLDHIYATSKLQLGKDLMKKLGNGKGEVLLIGDTIHDFEVAEEIGADSILFSKGHQDKERLLSCGVKVFDNLYELFV